MNNRRRLSRSELDLWRRATADVEPLTGRPDRAASKASPQKDQPAKTGKAAPVRPAETPRARRSAHAPQPAARGLEPTGPVDIDRRSWERLKRGQIEIERKLDLHGRTQSEAHRALDRFLTMAAAAGLRCVLVVTGKGGGDGRGVLRQMVPRWLGEADNRTNVLTYCSAQPRHGGDGALYVLLRRRRGDGRK